MPQRAGQLTSELCDLPWADHQPEPAPDSNDIDIEGDADRTTDAELFRSFSRMVAALYRFEFYDREQAIVEAWDSVNGDPSSPDTVTAGLTGLLDGANYQPVSAAELDDAMTHESLIPLRLEVDLNDYDELLLYRRGGNQETVEIPKWKGLRSEERTITVDERVVVHTRVKSTAWFDEQGIDPADRNLVPGHVSLKQFQNVPRADIEMLLPSTRVRFRPIDSLMVGIPAVASGIVVLATKLLPTLGLIFLVVGGWLGLRDDQPELDQTALILLFGGAVTLGGFFFKQWSKLKNRRVDYLKTLSENLYFRTLADGPGVLHSLLAAAEEQEVVEVLLSYRFLLNAPEGRTAEALDTEVEAWLRSMGHGEIDFEVDDAISKLHRLEIVEGDETLRARPLLDSLDLLDRRWDDIFQYQRRVEPPDGSTETTPEPGRNHALVRLRQVVDRFGGRFADRRSVRQEDEDLA